MEGAPAVEVPALPPDGFQNTLADLVRVVKHFNTQQPNLTCAVLTAIDTWLTAANQQAKAGRIDAVYPNAEGAQGANDSYVSFMEFVGEVVQGGDYFLNRYLNGTQWLDRYDEMKLVLAETKVLIPKVQLKKAEVSSLVQKAEVLISAQEDFWNLYRACI